YTRKYYDQLVAGIECIVNNNDIKDYRYHISNDCTLYDIPKTFPKCEEKSKTIVDDDSYKKDTIRCESSAKVRESHAGLDTDADVLAHIPDASTGDQSLPTDGQALSTHRQAASASDETISYGNPFDSIQLVPLPSTDASLTDNGPSKPIYYAGLSASGVFFTSMVLYKV
ncbi:hypothetical protein PVBG_03311, partial [Plasmodium vivax Brazil I]